MIIPVDVTLEQLRSMTKEKIIVRLSTWLTKTIQNYNSNNALIRTKTIKHYIDGRQPTATEG